MQKFRKNVKNIANRSIVHKNSNLDNSLWKTKLKKSFKFHILRWTEFFNDNTHNSTINISIGENCLNKKHPFEYIVPPLQEGSEQLRIASPFLQNKNIFEGSLFGK